MNNKFQNYVLWMILFIVHVIPYFFLFDVIQLSTLSRTYFAILLLNSITVGIIFFLIKASRSNWELNVKHYWNILLLVIAISAMTHYMLSFFAMFLSIGISLVTMFYLIFYFKSIFLCKKSYL